MVAELPLLILFPLVKVPVIITMISVFRENRSVVRAFVFLCLLIKGRECFLPEWDLDFLIDDLFPVSPILANTKSLLEDLFKTNKHSMGKSLQPIQNSQITA